MEYRRLGNSGLKVSAIGLGSGSTTFAGRADDSTSSRIIDEAIEAGVTLFDTGETYAEGRAERLLGKALQHKRSDVILATKFGKDRSVGPSEQRGSRTRVMKAVEGSLQRLDTDYIDLYVLHEPDPETPIEETLRALDDLIRMGKVRYVGCSGFSAWQLADATWTSTLHGLTSFVCAGSEFNLLTREAERELVPCCVAHGVGFMPTMPLAQGFLTGKYQKGHPVPSDSRFGEIPPYSAAIRQDLHLYNRFLTEQTFAQLAKLETFARARDHSVAELAIAWLYSHPWLSAIPVGVSRPGQLAASLRALEWKLTNEDLNELDRLLDADPGSLQLS